MNKTVQEVTARIEARSVQSRERYMEMMRAQEKLGRDRVILTCSNIAHAAAGTDKEDKENVIFGKGLNVGIISAYNDMLSAHCPYKLYPDEIKAVLRSLGHSAQVAGATPAMCDGVTQGMPGMDMSLFSRDLVAQSVAVGLSHNIFDAVLLLGICDKIAPGLVMGAAAFGHLPTAFVPAGPMSTGISNEEKTAIRQKYAAGELDKDALQKLLAKSRGKLESIEKIVDMEMQAQGGALRLLILCDFIKKDKLSLVGTDKPVAAEIGAVPIFEHLRRGQRQGIRLGLLSGSVIIVPLDTEDKLRSILEEKNCEGTLKPIAGTEYGRFQMKGKSTHVTAAVTELFRQGDVNVLIGTKSLLGEGWDAPCTNALILATYVGSFMLSNQMRGRTIRTDPRQPEKTGNIWHLACIFPLKSGKTRHADFSGDYETLTRRFDSFLGVSWKDPVIESGLGRLNIPEFDSREQMEEVNRMMLSRASDREGLRQRWQEALSVIHGEMEIEQAQAVPKEELQTSYLFIHALGMEILNLLLTILLSMGRAFLRAGGSAALQVHLLGILILFTAFLAARYAVRLFRFGTPARRMKHIGDAVLGALLELGEIEEAGHCRTEVESAEGLLIEISLKGGTMRDKTAFAACMRELWGIIDNPRYLLARGGRKAKEFYAVPETFGKQKERALVFEKHVRRAMGRFRLVYTRTPEGRQILLRARTRSFVNKNQRVLTGKKVAKGKYE